MLAHYDADRSGLMELDEFANLARGLGYHPASYPLPPSYPPPPAYPPTAYQPAAYQPAAYPPTAYPTSVPYPTTTPHPSVLATAVPAPRIELIGPRPVYAAPINAPIRRPGAAQTTYAAPVGLTQATYVTAPAPAQTIYRPGGPMPPITTTTTTTAHMGGRAPERVSPWDAGRPVPAQSVHRPDTYRPQTHSPQTYYQAHRVEAAPAQAVYSPARSGPPQADATVRAVFERFDANRSGRLDYGELRNCLHALGVDVTPPEAAQVLADYDADHSGLMELDEFARLSHSLGYKPA